MNHPKDVAIPSLPRNIEWTEPEHERCFAILPEDLVAYGEACRAAGRAAAAEPEGAREIIEALVTRIESNECRHENTHRGGAIWTICDDCDKKWADDRGGFKPYRRPKELLAADRWLAAAPTPTASIAPKAEGEAVDVPGLGRMSDDDDGFLTLQFVDEESAQRFMRQHQPSVAVDDMPPMRIESPVAQAAAPELSTASIAEQFTHGMAQAAAAEADELARSIIRTLDLYIGHKPTFDSLCDDINRLARIFLARPETAPVAWLFECRKPGHAMRYASIEEQGTEHWPIDQWRSIIKTPLAPISEADADRASGGGATPEASRE